MRKKQRNKNKEKAQREGDRREADGWYLNFDGGELSQSERPTGTAITDSRPAAPSVCLCCCCPCPRPASAPWTWTKCHWPTRTGRRNQTPHLTAREPQDTQSSVAAESHTVLEHEDKEEDSDEGGGRSYLNNLLSSVRSCSFPPSPSLPHRLVLQSTGDVVGLCGYIRVHKRNFSRLELLIYSSCESIITEGNKLQTEQININSYISKVPKSGFGNWVSQALGLPYFGKTCCQNIHIYVSLHLYPDVKTFQIEER